MSVRGMALALPALFALHVAEEAPQFVTWFNARVMPQISHDSFAAVNAAAMLITLGVAALLFGSHEAVPALLGAAWVGLLMLANAVFHLVATLAEGRYCPGVVTGTFLYLPFSAVFISKAAREARLPFLAVLAAALAGGLPMGVHGYLIVFRGSRLF